MKDTPFQKFMLKEDMWYYYVILNKDFFYRNLSSKASIYLCKRALNFKHIIYFSDDCYIVYIY